jgi:hypothetical protein
MRKPITEIPYNNKQDTISTYRDEAFNKAKHCNGIPTSKSPKLQRKVPEERRGKATGETLFQWDFTNDYGEKITIREDGETKYPDGGLQIPHFNAGPTGEKLKQHHYFEKRNTQ